MTVGSSLRPLAGPHPPGHVPACFSGAPPPLLPCPTLPFSSPLDTPTPASPMEISGLQAVNVLRDHLLKSQWLDEEMRLCRQILSTPEKAGTRASGRQLGQPASVGKLGSRHGSGFGPSPTAPAPPLLPGDCTEESNQEVLIAQAGEARRPLWLCVNEQCAFQKYLS